MKTIPIFILNKDRLQPLQDQVTALRRRGYWNIIIIDNKSTYQPLLDWYKVAGVEVFFNPTPKTCNGSLYFLAYEYNIEKFRKPLTEGYYVFNDSDVVPMEECPNDFIEDMIDVCAKYKAHKVGLGLKIDDLPDFFYKKADVINIEGGYLNRPQNGERMPLFWAPVDTTFAVYAPGTPPVWGAADQRHETRWTAGPCLRTGGTYMGRHMPWYYDYNNLPEDEKYYILNLEAGKGPVWSFQAKEVVK